MAKKRAPVEIVAEEDCPSCPPVAALYLGTFSDMAILLMAFFVIALSIAIFTPELVETTEAESDSILGSERNAEVFEDTTDANVVMQQFRSEQVDPQVFDIIEEGRQQTPLPLPDGALGQETNVDSSNGLEVIRRRLATEIREGRVDTRIEDDRILVELLNPDVGDTTRELSAADLGGISAGLIEIFLQVATAQAETTSTIEVIDSSRIIKSPASGRDTDALLAVYRTVMRSLSEEVAAGQTEVRIDGDDVVIKIGGDQSFSSGSAQLRANFIPLLNSIGEALMPLNGISRVEGHTDNVRLPFGGRYSDNWDLSSARAAAVTEYLLDELYVRAGDIYLTALADTVPITDNDTAAGRALNRRIEIVFTPN